VESQIQTHLGELLGEVSASISNSWSALPQPDTLGLLERVLGVDTPVAQLIHRLGAHSAVQPAPIAVSAAISYLNEQVFDEASYLGDGIYQVSPAVVCAGAGSSDVGCTSQLAKLDLRLHTTVSPPVKSGVAPSDGGIVFAVQLGAKHDEPLTLTLRSLQDGPGLSRTWLTAELDLDVLQHSLSTLTGTGIPATALSGHLTVTLRGDPTGASLRVEIDRPLSIALAGASGDLAARDAFSLSSATAKVFDLVLVSQDRPNGFLELGFGETTVELPAAADTRRLGVYLAGLTANAALELPPLQLDADLTLGGRPATISLDGAIARSIELNPDDHGSLFFAINRDDPDPDTGARFNTLHAMPRLDLRMTADHTVLGDTPPLYDVSQIVLDGLVRATSSADRIELRSGTFHIDTTPTGHGFAASAGQCITGSETTTPDAAPFIRWTVGACR
jgi:hypothetical protein